MKQKVCVVTGAAGGLGFATAETMEERGYTVIYAARSLDKLKGKNAEIVDVSIPQSIEDFSKRVLSKYESVDILINNAAIYHDSADPSFVRLSFETNALGPLALSRSFMPKMLTKKYGRIVNVSSGMGQWKDLGSGFFAYRLSKLALNAVTRELAASVRGQNLLVNSVCPGWVRTKMGGASAPRSIEEGISGIVWAATLPESGPSGGFFRDGKEIEW